MPVTDPSIPLVHAKTGSKLKGHALLYSVSVFLSIGVWLFGYDQGVMSGIITGPYFKAYFHQPTSAELGNMVAVLEIGAFITSLLAAPLADNYGRRMTLRAGAFVFTVGGAIQTFCTSYMTMVIGRIISGFGVGMLSMIVPIYQSEISPADHRGLLGAVEFTGNIIGYASSVWIDYACSYLQSDWSWRVPLFVQCFGGLVLAFGSFITPESPRYLVDTDQEVEGLAVIADFQGKALDDEKVLAEYKEIRDAVLADRAVGDRSYKALWKRYKGRVLIAMSSQMFAQLNGINVISYYAPLVFEQAGWIGRDAILMTGINSLFYIASSIPPWFLTDRAGRRPILLTGAVAMAVALTATGWWIYIDQAITPNAVVVCVIIYNSAFGMSWGPIPWLYPPEIMPLAFRAKGVSISTATNWLFNWWVGESTPVFRDLIGWRLYPMHAFFCCISFVLVYFLYPETRGVPLEEMDKLFGDEIVDDDDDEDDEDEDDGDEDGDEGSETSSMLANSRSSSRHRSARHSLPTSRKPSPLPTRMDHEPGFIGRIGNAVNGMFGGRRRKSSVHGTYNAVGGHEQ
ncbi:putative receptor [Naematelia encephala]|uniref:Putative receptor n=1 Tax=Naematelia encephala TaxID=71784 RepID=A0A1Y2B0L9_9TREE|nr:putative receptor [Naematelia encephala]